MKLPSTNILILVAVCIAIIGGAGAYRIAGAARETATALAAHSSLAVDASSSLSTPNQQILDALQTASLDQIQNDSDSPFTVLPTDNITDRFAKNIFTTYASSQYSDSGSVDEYGNSIDASTDIDQQASQVMANIDTSKVPAAKYSTADLTLFSPKTKDDLRAYGNQFASVQTNGLAVIANNPNKYNNDLAAISVVYAKVAKDIMQIKAPANAATLQVEIANDFSISAESFVAIGKQDTDPLAALLALKAFQEANARLGEAEYELEIYFQQSGILFGNNEAGYIWTVGAAGTSTASVSSGSSN